MRSLTLLFAFLVSGLILKAQTHTVENFNVEPDGEQLKITYRIGASNQTQLFKVTVSCSMDGRTRFEPTSVIGDVGNNVVGGKSIYTIMWDVFEDVDEVVNPNITVKVDLMNPEPPSTVTRTPKEPEQEVQEEPVKEEETQMQEPVYEPVKEPETYTQEFQRNGFFAFSGITGYGIPVGISFGSLDAWGYYVTPMRIAFNSYDYWDSYYGQYETDMDLHMFISAGATRNIVGKGLFRLHGYLGAGGHVVSANILTEAVAQGHFMMETGVQGVIGGLYLSAGFELSVGYTYPVSFVYGIGFAF